MDKQPESLAQIDAALLQRGFKRDWKLSPRRVWTGTLIAAGNKYPVSFAVYDLDFVRIPEIGLKQPAKLPDRLLPHLMADDLVCYLDPTSAVLDRYDPGGVALFCLDRAQRVLEDSVRGKLDSDIAVEFARYWDAAAYVDLPLETDCRDVVLYWLALHPNSPDIGTAIVSRKGRLNRALKAQHKRIASNSTLSSEPCFVLRVRDMLTVNPTSGAWPISSLAALRQWLANYVDDPAKVLTKAIGISSGNRAWLGLQSPNGFYLAEIIIPKPLQKPEFVQNRRKSLPSLLLQQATSVRVSRHSGFRIDPDYVYGRNTVGMNNLFEKRIALVGCGTIGGFIAHWLAESGCGAKGGELHLFDRDTLQTGNLGRHLLGIPYLDRPKAEGVKSFLDDNLPHLSVQAHVGNVTMMMEQLLAFDLVVDATGEEALSIALNELMVRKRPNSPPVLFVYLLANGAAAQALLSIDTNHACFKCLKPDLARPPRFRVVKDQAEAVLVRTAGCGDGLYAPFPVSRSAQAAALATEMVLDWANGRPRPLFRVRTLDSTRALSVKDANPSPAPQCPACGDARA